MVYVCFFEILARNYAPGAAAPGTAAPGACIICILSQICSRSIFECTMLQEQIAKYAPGVYLKCTMLQKHVLSAPGALYIQILLLEHTELRILPQIIHELFLEQIDRTNQRVYNPANRLVFHFQNLFHEQ